MSFGGIAEGERRRLWVRSCLWLFCVLGRVSGCDILVFARIIGDGYLLPLSCLRPGRGIRLMMMMRYKFFLCIFENRVV